MHSGAPPVPDEVVELDVEVVVVVVVVVDPPVPPEPVLVPVGSKIEKFCVHATGTSAPRARTEAKKTAEVHIEGF